MLTIDQIQEWEQHIKAPTTCNTTKDEPPLTVEMLKDRLSKVIREIDGLPVMPAIGDKFWLNGQKMVIISVGFNEIGYVPVSNTIVEVKFKYDME